MASSNRMASDATLNYFNAAGFTGSNWLISGNWQRFPDVRHTFISRQSVLSEANGNQLQGLTAARLRKPG